MDTDVETVRRDQVPKRRTRRTKRRSESTKLAGGDGVRFAFFHLYELKIKKHFY